MYVKTQIIIHLIFNLLHNCLQSIDAFPVIAYAWE